MVYRLFNKCHRHSKSLRYKYLLHVLLYNTCYISYYKAMLFQQNPLANPAHWSIFSFSLNISLIFSRNFTLYSNFFNDDSSWTLCYTTIMVTVLVFLDAFWITLYCGTLSMSSGDYLLIWVSVTEYVLCCFGYSRCSFHTVQNNFLLEYLPISSSCAIHCYIKSE